MQISSMSSTNSAAHSSILRYTPVKTASAPLWRLRVSAIRLSMLSVIFSFTSSRIF